MAGLGLFCGNRFINLRLIIFRRMVKKSPAHKDPVLAGLTPEQQQRAETYKAILVKGVNS